MSALRRMPRKRELSIDQSDQNWSCPSLKSPYGSMRVCASRKMALNTNAAASWDRLLGLTKMMSPVSSNLCVDKTL